MDAKGPWILVAVAEAGTRRAIRKLTESSPAVLFTADGRTARDILQHNRIATLVADPSMLERLSEGALGHSDPQPVRVVAVTDGRRKPPACLPPSAKLVHLATPDGPRALCRALALPDAPEPPRERRTFPGCGRLVGDSGVMRAVFERIRRVGLRDSAVLVHGESGTGKTLAARAVHACSHRRRRPFVVFDCAAAPPNLMESTLFGHTRGAFTGADRRRSGSLEAAAGGTLFLDDIDAMDPSMQAKLLRVVQDRQFVRVGSVRVIQVDVRFIAATNRDPAELVRAGALRPDLYYRLNVLPLDLPPLRDRPGDIGLLTDYFMQRLALGGRNTLPTLTAAARRLLEGYEWPGNVRELRNLVERLLTLTDATRIDPAAVVPLLMPLQTAARHENLRQATRSFQYRHICRVLAMTRGNRSRAASLLGIHRNTLLSKLAAAGPLPPPRSPTHTPAD